MRYEWDEDKWKRNRLKHGLDFAIVEDFDWTSALVAVDDRVRLHVLAFTLRDEDLVRVIMLRKATRTEVRRYEEAQR